MNDSMESMINVKMNGLTFSVKSKASHVITTKNQSFMDSVPHLNCLTELLFRISRVVFSSCNAMCITCMAWPSR